MVFIMNKPIMTQDVVREILDYNSITGILTWRYRDRKWFATEESWKIWNKRFSGKPAFTAESDHGRRIGTIFGKTYLAHRVIFLWMTGRWPNPEVDHDNHNPADNRWCNLKEVTHLKNGRNQSIPYDNISGHIGVRKRRNTYQAYISVNDHQHCLGSFRTMDEAVLARKVAQQKFGFNKGHGDKKSFC